MKWPVTFALFLISCLHCTAQVDDIRILKQRLPTVKDSLQYINTLNRIAMLQYEQNIDSTWYYTRMARDMASRLDYAKGLADATNNLGVFFYVKGNNPLALRYYNDAYNQYMASGDSSNVVQTLMNIAMVYNEDGKDEKSIDNLNHAMRLGASLTHDSIMSLVIYNYLLMYPKQFTADSTALYIDKATKIAVRYNDRRLLLAVQQLKADNLIAAGKRDDGIKLLQQTVDDGFNQGLYYMTIDVLTELGDLYAATDSIKAVFYYKQGLQITEQRKYISYTQLMAQKLYDFYTTKKNDSQAFYYARKLLEIYAIKEDNDRQSGIDYIQYAMVDQELAAARQKSAYNMQLLWLACIACALAIVIAVIVWRNARHTRQTHKVLQQQYNRLEITTEELEKSNQQYARLHKVVAHDLRNPIGAIFSITGIMADGNGERDKEWLGMINESSRRCLQLVNELLETDFTMDETALNKEPVNLHHLLQQTEILLGFKAREKKQQLVLEDEVKPVLQADRQQLSRVFDNLLTNAIKFSPVESTITTSVVNKDGNVLVAVRDEGIGIPAKMATHLFDPFTSAKRKGTAGEPTYGLGLYICKQIVEAHGGSIWFESEEGRGTTFFVQLKK